MRDGSSTRGNALRAAVLALLLGLPASAHAGPLFLIGAQYGAPTRAAGTAAIVLPVGPQRSPKNVQPSAERSGVLIGASAATGGEQVSAGLGAMLTEGSYLLTYGFDIRGTLTRTREAPRGATADATYAGAEAGLTLSVVR